MADVDVKGPLYTGPGEQGGLGGEEVHNPEPKAITAPDPLGLIKAKGASKKSEKK